MVSATFQKRVRYAETDKMGYLYYGHYAKYYEIGRAEMIRDLGLSYLDMEETHHIMMPVMRLSCKFRYPAYYDDLLNIQTTIPEMPTRFIQFDHKIYNQRDQLVNTGSVTLFFIDRATGSRINCPDFLSQTLKPYFE